MAPLTCRQLAAAFLAWTARHRAPKTVRFYEQRLKRFLAKHGDRVYTELNSLEIDEYLHEAGQGQSDSTRRHDAVALTTMQSFAVREKLIRFEERIFDKLEKPRMGRRERVPTQEEIDRLLAHARDDFKLIYRALSQCGARPAELCGALIEQIDWEKGKITLLHHKTARKTGMARQIAIGGKFEAMLREAIGDRTAGPVFLTRRGIAWTPARLSDVHRKLRDRAGLDKEIVLYLTRHRHATELLRAGLDIKGVADLLGHKSINTTMRYCHRDVSELRGKQDLID